MIKDFADLRAALAQINAPSRVDEPGQAIELGVLIGGEEHALALVWDPRATLLHVIVPLQIEVGAEFATAIALAVARVNHALVLPGFGLDLDHGRLYYRWVVPRLPEGLEPGEADRAMRAAVETAGDFLVALREVASGALPPESVLERAGALRAR